MQGTRKGFRPEVYYRMSATPRAFRGTAGDQKHLTRLDSFDMIFMSCTD